MLMQLLKTTTVMRITSSDRFYSFQNQLENTAQINKVESFYMQIQPMLFVSWCDLASGVCKFRSYSNSNQQHETIVKWGESKMR